MPDIKLSDAEIIRRYVRGDSVNRIPAGRDRIHRVLVAHRVPLRGERDANRTDKGRAVTAFSTLQPAAMPAPPPALPPLVPRYTGPSRLRGKLNRRRRQEQMVA